VPQHGSASRIASGLPEISSLQGGRRGRGATSHLRRAIMRYVTQGLQGRSQLLRATRHWLLAQDQLRDHTGKKRRYWLVSRFKGNNTRRPLFFSACVGIGTMVLVNNISARKNSRREVGGPAQFSDCKRQSSNSRGDILPPPLTSFELRAISAGECLVVSTVALCGAKPNSLTPFGSVGLPLLKITM
jgi:hypothetical protein